MPAGRHGRRGPAALRAVPKGTEPAGGRAPGRRGRARPWPAEGLQWSTRTVTCRRVPVSGDQSWEVVEYKYFVTVLKYMFLVSVLYFTPLHFTFYFLHVEPKYLYFLLLTC